MIEMDLAGSPTLADDASTVFSSYLKQLRQPLPDGELTPLFRRCRSHHFGPHDELHRLAIAYVLVLKFGSNTDVLNAARGRPIRRGETVDPVRIFVEAVTPTDGLSARNAQQRHSRDTRAIRYLEAQQLRPQKVVELGRRKGEGIHRWAAGQVSRATSAKQPHSRTASAVPNGSVGTLVRITMGNGEPRDWWLYKEDDIKQVIALLKRLQHQRLFPNSPLPR